MNSCACNHFHCVCLPRTGTIASLIDMGELDYNKPQSDLNKAKETGKCLHYWQPLYILRPTFFLTRSTFQRISILCNEKTCDLHVSYTLYTELRQPFSRAVFYCAYVSAGLWIRVTYLPISPWVVSGTGTNAWLHRRQLKIIIEHMCKSTSATSFQKAWRSADIVHNCCDKLHILWPNLLLCFSRG